MPEAPPVTSIVGSRVLAEPLIPAALGDGIDPKLPMAITYHVSPGEVMRRRTGGGHHPALLGRQTVLEIAKLLSLSEDEGPLSGAEKSRHRVRSASCEGRSTTGRPRLI
jgi:hypothetical protein